MNLRNPMLIASAAAVAASAMPCAAQTAANFPAKPILIIVPFAPAGPNDIIARIVGQKWTELWGHPTVIENRGGAGGTIGVEYGSKAPPDGYTVIMCGMSNMAVAVGLYPKLGYDPHELTALSNVAIVPYALAVNPTVPAKTVKELVAVAKTKKSLLSYGSSGTGAISHLAAELFKSMTGTDIVHVPYKGTAPALQDLIGGQIQLMLDTPSSMLPHVRAGKIKALGMTSEKRVAVAPDIPTLIEGGVQVVGGTWVALLAPAGTPKAIVDKLSREAGAAMRRTEIKDRFVQLGIEPVGSTSPELSAFLKSEVAKWAKVIKDANVKID